MSTNSSSAHVCLDPTKKNRPPELTDGQIAVAAQRPQLYPGPIPWGVLSRMSQRILSIDLLQYGYHPRSLLLSPSAERPYFCPRGSAQTVDRRRPRNSIAITYPFHPVQVIILNMVFCLPTILDNVLSRERRFRSMPPEELPELLTFVVRYDGLDLTEMKSQRADSEFGRRSTRAL